MRRTAPSADISWSPDTLVQPDVFVFPIAEAKTWDWRAMKSMLLAVEILSPSSLSADRFAKRRSYQEVGVPLYWVVDGDARTVEVWRPELHFPETEHERIAWHPTGASAPLEISLAELFRDP